MMKSTVKMLPCQVGFELVSWAAKRTIAVSQYVRLPMLLPPNLARLYASGMKAVVSKGDIVRAKHRNHLPTQVSDASNDI
jgi:hypothetical protein